MRKKIIFLFAALAFCGVAESQFLYTPKRSFFLSAAGLYDWQIMNGGPFDYGNGTSAGVRAVLEGGINYLWSYRLQASIPGLYTHGYDRRATGGVDIVLNLDNLIVQSKTFNNFYIALGAGAVYGASLNGLFSFYGEAGFGYNYFIWNIVGVYAEADFTFYTSTNDFAATLALGLRLKIK